MSAAAGPGVKPKETKMDYKTLSKSLVQRCLKKGAEAAEVYLESGRNLSLRVRNGEIETVQESALRGVGFRLFVKGKMAFSSCNNLSESSLDEAIASAVEYAKHTTPDDNNILPDEQGITEVEGLYDPKISQVPMEKKIEIIKKVEKLAMKDPRITKSAGARYYEGEGVL